MTRFLLAENDTNLIASIIEDDGSTNRDKGLVCHELIKGLFVHFVPFIQQWDGAP